MSGFNIQSILYNISIGLIPILFAITLHEVAHGWVANKLGDNTAKMLGRLSVNPIKHIDPIGTVILSLFLYVTTGFMFGWAKPVPVNPRNLRSPRKHMALVAAAGPLSNIIMAIFWVLVLKLSHTLIIAPTVLSFIVSMASVGILINVILCVFNFLPIPPLDGSKVLSAFVPRSISTLLDKLEPYGIIIVLGLFYFGVLDKIITPAIAFFVQLFI